MLPSLRTFLTTVAVLTVTVNAIPQDGSGFGASTSTSSFLAVPSSSSTASTTGAASTTTACNNSPDLCTRSYGNITHMGAHDSSFLRDESTSNSIAGNQYFNATVALDAGIRLLQIQVHNEGGVIEMCHTSCSLLDAGPLQDWLVIIKSWMDSHPNEVVTLLIVNSDGKAAADFGSVFSASGIDTYGYVPSGVGAWPTLQEMINANKRLVTFIASITANSQFPYLLSEFDYVFETPFEVTELSGFNCTLDRPSSQNSASAAIQAGMLPLMNHFKYDLLAASIMVPDEGNISTTNSPSTTTEGNLGLHAQTCLQQWGIKPSFVLVDFFSEGPAVQAADNLNGIKAVGRTTTGQRVTTVATATAGLKHRGLGMGAGALVAFVAAALVLV
ncbi:PLC-like phosphodiesterase [Hypomontagnella monticulosa]|nr:PLC-like phosphodiesterase [Hypomontagnella monticulosa]